MLKDKNLEDICCSLEYAIKFKKLGVKQKSLFFIIDYTSNHYLQSSKNIDRLPRGYKKYSAFTCSELGNMLPQKYLSGKVDKEYNCWEFDKDWLILNYNTYKSYKESDARAKMLIYILENKLITVEEVNGRIG